MNFSRWLGLFVRIGVRCDLRGLELVDVCFCISCLLVLILFVPFLVGVLLLYVVVTGL